MIVVMDISYILPRSYTEKGFAVSKFAGNALALTYRGQPIFIFSSGFDLRSDLAPRLCEAYLKTLENTFPNGQGSETASSRNDVVAASMIGSP